MPRFKHKLRAAASGFGSSFMRADGLAWPVAQAALLLALGLAVAMCLPSPAQAAPPSAARTYDGSTGYLFLLDDNTDQLYTLNPSSLTSNAQVVGPCPDGDAFGVGLTRPRGLAGYAGRLWLLDDDSDALYRVSPYNGCARSVGIGVAEFGKGYDAPFRVAACETTQTGWMFHETSNGVELAKLDLSSGISDENDSSFETDTGLAGLAGLQKVPDMTCGGTYLQYVYASSSTYTRISYPNTTVHSLGDRDGCGGNASGLFSPKAFTYVPTAEDYYAIDGTTLKRYHSTQITCLGVPTAVSGVPALFGVNASKPVGLQYMVPPAAPPADDPSIASSRRQLVQYPPGSTYTPPRAFQVFEVLDGEIFTEVAPVIDQSGFDDALDSGGNAVVAVSLSWSGVAESSYYQVESSDIHSPPVVTDVFSLGNQFTEEFPAADSQSPRMVSYRVRSVLQNTASTTRTVVIEGRTTILPPHSTVYSPWSRSEPILFQVGGSGLRADITKRAPDEVDQPTDRAKPVQEGVNVITALAGIPADYDDLFAILGYFGVSAVIAGLVFVKGDMRPDALFLGCSFMAVICSVGGPALVGLPWGWMALPGALLMAIGILSLKARDVLGRL